MPVWTCPECNRQFGRRGQGHECSPALSFSLRHEVAHQLIVRKPVAYHGRYWHTANLRSPEDVDDDVKQWLTEAYLDAASE